MKGNQALAIAVSFLACAPFCVAEDSSGAAGAKSEEEKPRFEAGLRGGAGLYAYIDNKPYARGVLGIEGCAFCSGRYGLFAEYSHFLAPGPPSRYESADLISFGLRIQGRRRVSPFFDVGFAAGHSRFQWGTGVRGISTAGAGFGAGIAVRAGRHLYVRPQLRLYVMSELYAAEALELGIGWRF